MADTNGRYAMLNFGSPNWILPPITPLVAGDLQRGLHLVANIQASNRQPDPEAEGGIGHVAYAASGGSLRPAGRRRSFG